MVVRRYLSFELSASGSAGYDSDSGKDGDIAWVKLAGGSGDEHLAGLEVASSGKLTSLKAIINAISIPEA